MKELSPGIRKLVVTDVPDSAYFTSVEVLRGDTARVSLVDAREGVGQEAFGALTQEGDTVYWRFDPEDSDFLLRFVLPELVEVEMSGAMEAYLDLTSTALTLRASGDCEVTVEGVYDQLTLHVEGAAIVGAEDAQARVVHVRHNASNDLLVAASETLAGEVLDDGDVYFRGRPSVDVRVTGRGGVMPMDSFDD